MSTIKVNNIVPPNAGEGVSIDGLQMPTAGPLSNRNIVINGAMRVAQRATSVTGLGNNDSNYHTVDRFKFTEGGTHTFELTMAQSTDAPTGFSNSLRLDTTTAQANPNASDQLFIEHRVEGQDLQPLAYGTASAKSFTLSFWVKSNVTGNYVVWFRNHSNEASCNHIYTINSSNVWEYKTITVSGDTANAFANDNTLGLSWRWILSTGSDFTSGTASQTWVSNITDVNRYVGQTANIVQSTDNDWSITGIQLEVGSKSTPFEHRSYSDELQRCQRYLFRVNAISTDQTAIAIGHNHTTNGCRAIIHLPVSMRAEGQSVTEGGLDLLYDNSNEIGVSITSLDEGTNAVGIICTASGSPFTVGRANFLRLNDDANAFFQVESEL